VHHRLDARLKPNLRQEGLDLGRARHGQ
jgi:hypothetical protein